MDKISIIVPVYNSEKYLEDCIRSVIDQTHVDFELLLINDGSTDDSHGICMDYSKKDSRIITITQTNKGVSSARNTGIMNATGDYLVFLDSDDELERESMEVLLTTIKKYGADISSANKRYVDNNTIRNQADDDGETSTFSGKEMLKASLLYNKYTHSLHGKMFARRFIGDIRFKDGHNINEDGYFLFECYKKHPKVAHTNISVYKYYKRKNSASLSKFSEKYFDMIYFCDLKMEYVKETVPEFLECAKNMEARTHMQFLEVLCSDTTSKYKCAERKSIRIVRRRYFKFKPISRHEKILSIMITFGLFWLYKMRFRIKYSKYYNR